RLLEPLADGGLDDRLSQCRHANLGSHGLISPLLSQRLLEQRPELSQMLAHQPGRGRRRRGTPRVARALVARADMLEHPGDVRLDEAPGAHVLRLLLAPYHLGLLET